MLKKFLRKRRLKKFYQTTLSDPATSFLPENLPYLELLVEIKRKKIQDSSDADFLFLVGSLIEEYKGSI